MTFKEWMIENKPEYMTNTHAGGVYGCPYHYNLESLKESTRNCKLKKGKGCEYCWNREMSEPPKRNGAFTKSDLKDGMVVEYRDGRRQILINGFLLGIDSCCDLKNYDNELKEHNRKIFDICVVYKVVDANFLCSMLKTGNYGIEEIWRHKEPIRITPQEAADKLHELTGDTYEIEG